LPALAGAEGSAPQRACVAGKQLDQIRLPARAGLLIKTTEMGLDRALADAERLGDLRPAATSTMASGMRIASTIGLGDRLGPANSWRKPPSA
jgi:hypothetical protein